MSPKLKQPLRKITNKLQYSKGETGIFYHGTSKETWEKILKEGHLWGVGRSYRYTYLTPERWYAEGFGDVILEVKYKPVGINETDIDNYGFDPPTKDVHCWQFSVFVPILLTNVRRIR